MVLKGHLRDHSAIAKPLYDMVIVTTKNKLKLLTWTDGGHAAFKRTKALVNVCPKLYFIDYSLRIILYTDASARTFADFDEGVVEEKFISSGHIPWA